MRAASFDYEGGAAAALAMFSDEVVPDALFCANDLMALGAIDALRRKRGMRVPDDVLVAGFDDIPAAAWGAYDLTTVVQDARAMVEQAVDLLDTIDPRQTNEAGSRVTIPAVLKTRGSTDRRR